MHTSKTVLASAVLLITFATTAVGLSDEITDAVTTTNVKVVGTAPYIAMGNVYMQTQSGLLSEYSGACHAAATAQCMAVVQEGKLLQADETGNIPVSLPDQFNGIECQMTGCDGLNPKGVTVR